jgi:deazaflavin-dependent oxidoreductase (nitroreductase family)
VSARDVKRGLAKGLTARLATPVVRPLIERGLFPTAWCLLETTGRRSGLPRRTPVGDGLRGRAFWVVTEHGWASDYVKNVQADPRVRVKRGRTWLRGTATILPDDDAAARLRWLHRPVNDTALRALGTEQLVLRIDLDA